MTIGDYLLLPLILLALMMYPLLRKGISLLEIFVNKYVHTTPAMSANGRRTPSFISSKTGSTPAVW